LVDAWSHGYCESYWRRNFVAGDLTVLIVIERRKQADELLPFA
jgi:hypothetical protein